MSDIVFPIAEHLMGVQMFAPWLTWFCREIVIYFFKGSTRISSLTGLALTVGVIIQIAYDRVGHLFEVVTSYEVCIVLVLVLITLVKTWDQPTYATRDVPMVLVIATISTLAVFGVNIMLGFPIFVGIILGLFGMTGAISRERTG